MFQWLLPKSPSASVPGSAVAFQPEEAGGDAHERRPLKTSQRRGMANRPPSFTELLPWTGFRPEDEVFTLHDGVSVGAIMELTPVPSEAKTEAYMDEVCRKVQAAIQALPETQHGHWIVQFYGYDDRNIQHLKDRFVSYIREVHADNPVRGEAIVNSSLTQEVIEHFSRHLDRVSHADGLFEDTQVSGNVWRGQERRVKLCLYRLYPARYEFDRDEPSPAVTLNRTCGGLVASLLDAGIRSRRCNGRDFYEWLFPFFNRRRGFPTTEELLKAFPYPGDASAQGRAPVMEWDLASFLNASLPKTDEANGCFEFDGIPVKALTLQKLTAVPQPGHLTGEREYGGLHYALFDRLPANSMLSITVLIKPQDMVTQHVESIRDRSKAIGAEPEATKAECERVLQHMRTGDKLYPTFVVLYLSADDHEALRQQIHTVTAQLSNAGLRFIEPKHDLTPHDAFVRGLPMCWDPDFDAKELKRGRLMFGSQIASLLPVYGRSRGTGHPGVPFWNRGGESLWFDPLYKRDRKKNGHLLELGPSGAGKSSTLMKQCLFALAIHLPRLFIADAGKSFGLLKSFVERHGLKVHYVELSHDNDVSLPPFALAAKLLADPDVMATFAALDSADAAEQARAAAEMLLEKTAADSAGEQEEAQDDDADDTADKQDEREKRDYLGEMLIAAVLMITGGEEAELTKLTRADRYLITKAIIQATLEAARTGKPHPLVQDVARALVNMSKDEGMLMPRRERVAEMGEAMMVFTQGLRGKLFNRYGQAWPEADLTLVEMGVLTNDGYEDALALAYTGLVDNVHSTGERYQAEGRQNVFLTDEAHVITTNQLLGPKLTKASKMWRKLYIWLWLATQDMKDFPDSMARVLNMCEWWILLTMEKAEIDEVARFKRLTPEEKRLMESTRKEPPKYTEGVVLSSTTKGLFRNVSPPIAIALAMTEGHEKAERRRLMKEHNCSELDAALHVARRLEVARA